MATNQNGQEKTEQATSRKLEKSREEGQVAKSVEISSFAVFSAGMLILVIYQSYLAGSISGLAEFVFSNLNEFQIQTNLLQLFAIKGYAFFFTTLMPFFAGIFVITFAANILQVGFKISPKAIKPKMSKLNPLQGLKKIFFSASSFVETAKSLTKFSIVTLVSYYVVKDLVSVAMTMTGRPIIDIVNFMSDSALVLIIKMALVYAVIAVADFIYQKKKFTKDQMMTKQEVKDESKQSEGNPEIKGRIKSVQAEMARKRMMKDLPSADVIITNPTHFAIALKYDPEKSAAPKVIAKGMDSLAQKIKKIGRENGIYLYEDRPMARLLYKTCEVGDEIPSQLFEAVAKILAFVFNLKNNKKTIV